MAGTGSSSDVLTDNLRRTVSTARLLVVGAGGIGCELLKNLVLTGLCYIDIIDLDTIDVSNLNRQFLFQKKHVGKSKAEVAKESCLRFNPDAHITAHYDSIFRQKFHYANNPLVPLYMTIDFFNLALNTVLTFSSNLTLY
jgi:ubiquitin-like 1-activating enzyme E1 B